MPYGIITEEAVVTCTNCKCRLDFVNSAPENISYYKHFGENFVSNTDARGCNCFLLGYFFIYDANTKTTHVARVEHFYD